MDKFITNENPETLMKIKQVEIGIGGNPICIGIEFSDQDVFDKWIRETPILQVKLPCGCEAKYHDRLDIPHKTVQCEHGNYFVKIGN